MNLPSSFDIFYRPFVPSNLPSMDTYYTLCPVLLIVLRQKFTYDYRAYYDEYGKRDISYSGRSKTMATNKLDRGTEVLLLAFGTKFLRNLASERREILLGYDRRIY